MRRGYGLLITSVSLVLAGCTGDEFLVGQGGHDGGGGGATTVGPGGSTSSSTTSGSTSTTTGTSTSTGSGCDGCMKDGACVQGNAFNACGIGGEVCDDCTSNDPCRSSSCSADQACVTVTAEDGAPCPFVEGDEASGACQGGTCEKVSEQCLNKTDDDDDDLVDCLDPDCDAAYVCVGNAPSAEWKGPFAVYLGAVECPGIWGAPISGDFGIGIDPGDACDCSCEATCTLTLNVDANPLIGDACAVSNKPLVPLAPEVCEDLGDSTSTVFAQKATTDVTCVGTVGSALAPPTFVTPVTICESTEAGLGCDAASCRPRPSKVGELKGRICIQHEGDQTCEGPFTSKTLVETDLVDGRTCECGCTASCEPGRVDFYDEVGCTQCGGVPGACDDLGVNGDDPTCAVDFPNAGTAYAKWTDSAASCTTDDTVTGEIETTTVTLCCLPYDDE